MKNKRSRTKRFATSVLAVLVGIGACVGLTACDTSGFSTEGLNEMFANGCGGCLPERPSVWVSTSESGGKEIDFSVPEDTVAKLFAGNYVEVNAADLESLIAKTPDDNNTAWQCFNNNIGICCGVELRYVEEDKPEIGAIAKIKHKNNDKTADYYGEYKPKGGNYDDYWYYDGNYLYTGEDDERGEYNSEQRYKVNYSQNKFLKYIQEEFLYGYNVGSLKELSGNMINNTESEYQITAHLDDTDSQYIKIKLQVEVKGYSQRSQLTYVYNKQYQLIAYYVEAGMYYGVSSTDSAGNESVTYHYDGTQILYVIPFAGEITPPNEIYSYPEWKDDEK